MADLPKFLRRLLAALCFAGASAMFAAAPSSQAFAQSGLSSGGLENLSRTLQQMQQQGRAPFGSPQNPNRGYQVLPNADVPAGSGWRPSTDQPIMRTRPPLPQASGNWAVCRPPCGHKQWSDGSIDRNYCVCPPGSFR